MASLFKTPLFLVVSLFRANRDKMFFCVAVSNIVTQSRLHKRQVLDLKGAFACF